MNIIVTLSHISRRHICFYESCLIVTVAWESFKEIVICDNVKLISSDPLPVSFFCNGSLSIQSKWTLLRRNRSWQLLIDAYCTYCSAAYSTLTQCLAAENILANIAHFLATRGPGVRVRGPVCVRSVTGRDNPWPSFTASALGIVQNIISSENITENTVES